MQPLRRLLAFLALLAMVAGGSGATAHAPAAMVEICADGMAVRIAVDAQGRPVNAPASDCPCTLCLCTGPAPALPPQPAAVTARLPRSTRLKRAPRPRLCPALRPSRPTARGPPAPPEVTS